MERIWDTFGYVICERGCDSCCSWCPEIRENAWHQWSVTGNFSIFMQSFLTRASIKTLEIPHSCTQVIGPVPHSLGMVYVVLSYLQLRSKSNNGHNDWISWSSANWLLIFWRIEWRSMKFSFFSFIVIHVIMKNVWDICNIIDTHITIMC